MSRPSSYKPEYPEQAKKLCLLGATDKEIADFFGVAESTLYVWKNTYPEFSEALKAGKDEADERVERSLYHKALGYSFDSEKVFMYQGAIVRTPFREHIPPSDTACIFWLKNRRADRWRDVHKIEHGKPGDFSNMSDDELNQFIASGQGAAGEGDSRKEKASGKGAPRTARRLN